MAAAAAAVVLQDRERQARSGQGGHRCSSIAEVTLGWSVVGCGRRTTHYWRAEGGVGQRGADAEEMMVSWILPPPSASLSTLNQTLVGGIMLQCI